MADRPGTSCKIFLSNRCWLAYGPLLHTLLPRAMPAIPFSEVLQQGPGLPSDAYQPQRQVWSSGLSQRGWGGRAVSGSSLVLRHFPLSGTLSKSCKNSSQSLSLFLPLIHTYRHTHTYYTFHHQRQNGKSPYWLVSYGSCRRKGAVQAPVTTGNLYFLTPSILATSEAQSRGLSC